MEYRKRFLTTLFFIIPLLSPGVQQEVEHSVAYLKEVPTDHLLYLPGGYGDTEEEWPLILFLHGSGERGEDLEKVKLHGLPAELEKGRSLPAIVVSPQCPLETRWDVKALKLLLDDLLRRYRVDPDRVYLTGLSMGGFGTWALAAAYPDYFAALAPVCGGGDPETAKAMRHIPQWVFHGVDDEVVPIRRSEEMVEALEAAGAEVRFTRYPDVGHDSWTATYAKPELYEWLLGQRRP